MKRGFTLIELLVVVAIMGLLGATSIGGYQAMRRGMEERGVMQSINQFVRSAYQRAVIDRQPITVCFWNETRALETDLEPMKVVGRAVAVRQLGRLTRVESTALFDEFGDLHAYRYINERGESEDNVSESKAGATSAGNSMYLYRMKGRTSRIERSLVGQTTVKRRLQGEPMAATGGECDLEAYAFVVSDLNGVSWQVGDPYGMPIADLDLANGYLFGSSQPSTSLANPISEAGAVTFMPSDLNPSVSMSVSSFRPNKGGALTVTRIGTIENPNTRQN